MAGTTRASPLGNGRNPLAFSRVTTPEVTGDATGAADGRNQKNRVKIASAATTSAGAGKLTRIVQNCRQTRRENRGGRTADR
jgi:hypothetical protein